jgi:hypothetical protein
MRTLERNQRTVYHCTRQLTDGGVEYFSVATPISCNPMPVSTDWTQAGKGFVESSMKRFVLPKLTRDVIPTINEGDRFYVDAVVPTNTDEQMMAKGSDYVVYGVEDTPNQIAVILKRLAV